MSTYFPSVHADVLITSNIDTPIAGAPLIIAPAASEIHIGGAGTLTENKGELKTGTLRVGNLLYAAADSSANTVLTSNGAGTISLQPITAVTADPILPNMRMGGGSGGSGATGAYIQSNVAGYIARISTPNRFVEFYIAGMAAGVPAAAAGPAYAGGVYSPTQSRIYMIPYGQSSQSAWHYIDCVSGNVVAYAHGAGGSIGSNAYFGGAYSPTNNRIYMAPSNQGGLAQWHYIDCASGAVVAYAHGMTGGTIAAVTAYAGAVYSPVNDRVYFVPYNQTSLTYNRWHYVDCASGAVVAYPNVTTATLPYVGGVYSPVENKVYFAPYGQTVLWHYIDCSGGGITVGNYAAPTGLIGGAYFGGAYSPTQNRIYFVPHNQIAATTWHAVNCDSGAVMGYAAPGGTEAYAGGVYIPTQNRIYFIPYRGGAQWHYIDCNASGGVVQYVHGAAAVADMGYVGGVYCPLGDRIYMIPYMQGSESTWHYIYNLSNGKASASLMAGGLFNKM